MKAECFSSQFAPNLSTVGFDSHNNYLMAQMSRLAYGYNGDPEFEDLVKDWFGEAYSPLDQDSSVKTVEVSVQKEFPATQPGLKSMDSRFIGLSTETFVVIAFRGTFSLQDYVIDVFTHPTALPTERISLDGKVHGGFMWVVAELQSSVEEALQKLDPEGTKPVFVAGHSLGGAQAVLAGITYPCFENLAGIYTYGQPVLGSPQFRNSIEKSGLLTDKYFRVVREGDLISVAPLLAERLAEFANAFSVPFEALTQLLHNWLDQLSGWLNQQINATTGLKTEIDLSIFHWVVGILPYTLEALDKFVGQFSPLGPDYITFKEVNETYTQIGAYFRLNAENAFSWWIEDMLKENKVSFDSLLDRHSGADYLESAWENRSKLAIQYSADTEIAADCHLLQIEDKKYLIRIRRDKNEGKNPYQLFQIKDGGGLKKEVHSAGEVDAKWDKFAFYNLKGKSFVALKDNNSSKDSLAIALMDQQGTIGKVINKDYAKGEMVNFRVYHQKLQSEPEENPFLFLRKKSNGYIYGYSIHESGRIYAQVSQNWTNNWSDSSFFRTQKGTFMISYKSKEGRVLISPFSPSGRKKKSTYDTLKGHGPTFPLGKDLFETFKVREQNYLLTANSTTGESEVITLLENGFPGVRIPFIHRQEINWKRVQKVGFYHPRVDGNPYPETPCMFLLLKNGDLVTFDVQLVHKKGIEVRKRAVVEGIV